MSEERNESTITASSPVRLTVGLLSTILLSCAYFLYARDDFFYEKYTIHATAHESKVEAELTEIKRTLEGKANKTDASDRFTGSDFRTYSTNKKAEDEQFREFVRLQFTLTEKKNEVEHNALEERIEHLDDDLNKAVDRIDNHYNIRGLP